MKKKLTLSCVLLALLIGFTSAEAQVNNVCWDLDILTLPMTDDMDPTHRFREPGYETHIGTDWPLPGGSNIVAPHNAVVEFARDNDVPNYSFESDVRSFGNYIKLDLGNINGRRVKVVLAHLLHGSFRVSQGERVIRGQLLALSGNSGTSTAPHLDMTVYVDEVAVDPYDRVGNGINWLWTTNPPSHGVEKIHFSFPNHSPQNWSCGNNTSISFNYGLDQHTFQVIAQGSNPGVVSPVIEGGYTCNQLSMLHFSAKIRGPSRDTSTQIWVRDQNGDWNHGVERFATHVDYDYHHYAIDLSELGDTVITQFSIELTQDAGYEEWIFDWVELQSGTNQNVSVVSLNPSYDGVGGGIGGGSPNPTPTYASPPVVTIIDPGTGYREVKTDRVSYSPGDTVTVSWSGFESYSPSFRVLSY